VATVGLGLVSISIVAAVKSLTITLLIAVGPETLGAAVSAVVQPGAF
jgi:hypothetical protein